MKTLLIVMLLLSPAARALSISDLACGAIICLAGKGGSACAPYIRKYKSIDGPTRSATRRLRKLFLAKCDKKKPPNMTRYLEERARQLDKIKHEVTQ